MSRTLPFLLSVFCATLAGCALVTAAPSTPDDPVTQEATATKYVTDCVDESCPDFEPEPADSDSWTLGEVDGEFEELVLEFESGETVLEGSLFKPTDTTAPPPVLVIVHDLGPRDRTGLSRSSFGVELPVEIPIYHALAERLAARGIAVFTYDKRTCDPGSTAGCASTRTSQDQRDEGIFDILIQDIEAAANALKRRPDLDASRIGFIAHGHGATLVFNTRLDPTPWSVIAVHPSATAPDVNVLHQLDTSIAHIEERLESTKPSAEHDELNTHLERLRQDRDELEGAFARVRNAGESNAPSESILGTPAATWASLSQKHARALDTLSSTSTPTFVIVGDASFEAPRSNAQKFQELGMANDAVEVQELPSVCHLMVDLTDDPTRISDELTESILDFVDSESPDNSDP